MSASYINFAYYYDQLFDEAFYKEYVNRINNIKNFKNILDLGCGSGRLCFMLKNETNEVSGLDLSQEMLMMAQNYNIEHKCGVYFFNQDLKELKLNKNYYDLVTCTLDSLNYVEGIANVKHIFQEVYKSLQVGGYFMFDVLTFFYINNIVNDYAQGEELATFEYLWHVQKIGEDKIKHQLKISDNENDYVEEHYQYLYEPEKLVEMLKTVGFSNIEINEGYNEYNEMEASRLYFTCVKEK